MNKNIKYMVIDVDGTLTDAGIYYDENGNECKKFCTKDAIGFFVCSNVGIKTVVLTGRQCKATERRMKELKVDYLFQNVKDKYTFLKEFMQEKGITKEELAYIGDDLNDLAAMGLSGCVGCPADGCREIKERADYICLEKGGHGAVREFVEKYLVDYKIWSEVVSRLYGER